MLRHCDLITNSHCNDSRGRTGTGKILFVSLCGHFVKNSSSILFHKSKPFFLLMEKSLRKFMAGPFGPFFTLISIFFADVCRTSSEKKRLFKYGKVPDFLIKRKKRVVRKIERFFFAIFFLHSKEKLEN